MRVFISADIEGTTFTTLWDETERGKDLYPAAARQMTAEVKAACEGAIAAGADYILVNDAHDEAINLDVSQLPECVEVIRGWSGSPLSMVDGIDDSFDAVMFVGYHAAAGRIGNPLSHTHSTKTTSVTLNGKICSEFLLYSWACAAFGVPSVLLCGDKTLIDDSRDLHPALHTVAVKDGLGGCTKSINPNLACRMIREMAEKALSQDLTHAGITLPKHFVFEVSYKEHRDAVRRSFYPGFTLLDDHTIRMETDDFMDVLRAVQFCL
ncbi:MAG: M55 family metallopeptidase [Clostridia bacterium]|nr:M55 family metallopeptidase [Clostridia bacterium]